MSQTAVREGNAEYIKLRDGKRGITRQLSLETGEWVFTKLGLTYYKRLRRNYVVNVPVIIRGTPPDGRVYTKKSDIAEFQTRHLKSLHSFGTDNGPNVKQG